MLKFEAVLRDSSEYELQVLFSRVSHLLVTFPVPSYLVNCAVNLDELFEMVLGEKGLECCIFQW